LKKRLLHFLSNDRWIIVVLATMILLLGCGGVLLSRLVSAHMLRNDARSTSSDWVESLRQSADIPGLIAGAAPSEATRQILANASRVGDVYRYLIWDQTGRLIYLSERMPSSVGRTSTVDLYRQRVADTIRSGEPSATLSTGEAPENPLYFGVALIPLKQGGKSLASSSLTSTKPRIARSISKPFSSPRASLPSPFCWLVASRVF
jgi:hypothetical protein